jgi:hypothetical protein
MRLPLLGRLGRDRWQSRRARTNLSIGAIRLLEYEKENLISVQNPQENLAVDHLS